MDTAALARLERARARLIGAVSRPGAAPGAREAAALLAETRAHAWCFWVGAEPELPALLVSGEWNLSAFVLAGMFAEVEVWELDPGRAALLGEAADAGDLAIRVEHCPAERIAGRLRELPRPFGLVALQACVGRASRESGPSGREVVRALAASSGAARQCCVVSRNRRALRNLLRGGGTILPTPGEVARDLRAAGTGAVETLFLHPDHRAPTELLSRRQPLPRARRGRRLMRLAGRLGLVDKVLGSFACVAPAGHPHSLVHEALARARPWAPAGGRPAWRDGTIRDGSMLLLTVSLAPGEEAIARIPLSMDAAESLARARRIHAEFTRTRPDLLRVVPEPLPLFASRGWPCAIERRLRGVTARPLVRDPATRDRVRARVSEFVLDLYRPEMRVGIADEHFLAARIGADFDTVRAAEPASREGLDALERRLAEGLCGHPLPVGRIHGDFSLDHLFFDRDSLGLTGVIDWETSRADCLPSDFLHYLVSEEQACRPRPWGEIVARAVAGGFEAGEPARAAREHHDALRIGSALLPEMLACYWIRGVAIRVRRSSGVLEPKWREANFVGPLDAIGRALRGRAR